MMRNAAGSTPIEAPSFSGSAASRADFRRSSRSSHRRLLAGVLAVSFLGALAGSAVAIGVASIFGRSRSDSVKIPIRVAAPEPRTAVRTTMQAARESVVGTPKGTQLPRSKAPANMIETRDIIDRIGTDSTGSSSGDYVVDGVAIHESETEEKTYTLAF